MVVCRKELLDLSAEPVRRRLGWGRKLFRVLMIAIQMLGVCFVQVEEDG